MDPISLNSSLSGMIAAQDTGMQVAIATLKKTNDVAKMEGEALIQMLNDSLSTLNEHMLDVYA
jgi:hypothetical protein